MTYFGEMVIAVLLELVSCVMSILVIYETPFFSSSYYLCSRGLLDFAHANLQAGIHFLHQSDLCEVILKH